MFLVEPSLVIQGRAKRIPGLTLYPGLDAGEVAPKELRGEIKELIKKCWQGACAE